MQLTDIDLEPTMAVLCIGVALLLTTRLVGIYSHLRSARRARQLLQARRGDESR